MSDSDNPFSIDSKRIRNSPKRNRYPNVWSQSEQSDKLIGYLEIQPELWPSIKCGSHIRYITKNNEFKNGGIIMKNPYTYKGDSDALKPSIDIGIYPEYGDKVGFKLQNTFTRQSADYTVWVIAYDDLMKVYVKVDAVIRTIVLSLETTIDNINTNMKKITDYIKKMDDKISKLEQKNKHT